MLYYVEIGTGATKESRPVVASTPEKAAKAAKRYAYAGDVLVVKGPPNNAVHCCYLVCLDGDSGIPGVTCLRMYCL